MQSTSSSCRTIVVSQCCPQAMRKRDVWRVDQFHLLKKIGSGYASTVYLATCRLTGTQVALKLYHKSKLSELNYFQISREIRIHGSLDHRNIVQLWSAFEDQYGIYLVSEFAARGDVFTDVERRGGQISEAETVRTIIHPFLMALIYLHSHNVIHRDIKPENLLLTATGTLKVADFGLAICYDQERPVTRVGTLDYMSPEVVVCPDKHKPSDHKDRSDLWYHPVVDAWAVGVLAYELIVGRPPFDRGNKKATIAEILNAEPVLPHFVSEGAQHFIRWALTKDQTKRPGVQQLVEHPWVLGHMKQPMSRGGPGGRTGLLARTDSFVQPRYGAPAVPTPSSTSRESDSPEEVLRNLQLAHVQQSGRMITSSTSMTAMDMMRFRDVQFENQQGEGNQGLTPHATGAALPKRLSDVAPVVGGHHGQPSISISPTISPSTTSSGIDPVTAKRSSQAAAAAAVMASRSANGAAIAKGIYESARSGGGAAADLYGGGVQASAMSFSRMQHMSREELIASLQASAGRLPGSMGVGQGQQQRAGTAAAGMRNASDTSGSGIPGYGASGPSGSGMSPPRGAQAMSQGLTRQPSGGGFSKPQAAAGSPQQSVGSELLGEMSRLRTTSEANSAAAKRTSVLSPLGAASPVQSASGVPPAGSSSLAGVGSPHTPRVPLQPSRLSTSFSVTSPLVSASGQESPMRIGGRVLRPAAPDTLNAMTSSGGQQPRAPTMSPAPGVAPTQHRMSTRSMGGSVPSSGALVASASTSSIHTAYGADARGLSGSGMQAQQQHQPNGLNVEMSGSGIPMRTVDDFGADSGSDDEDGDGDAVMADANGDGSISPRDSKQQQGLLKSAKGFLGLAKKVFS